MFVVAKKEIEIIPKKLIEINMKFDEAFAC